MTLCKTAPSRYLMLVIAKGAYMKRYFLLLVMIAAGAFSIQAQTSPDAPELTRMLNEFLAGAGRNDAAVHDRFWAEDLIYTRGVGVRIGKAELMKGVRAAPASKPGDPVTVYSAEDVRVQQYGNAAVVAFKLVGNTTNADGSKSTSNHLNTGTFIKRKGKWQVVAWQATPVPKPAPEIKTSSGTTIPVPLATSAVDPTPARSAATSRTYLKGSRGGCYYLNAGGNKVYVDRTLCK